MASQSAPDLDAGTPTTVGSDHLEHVGAGVGGDQQGQEHSLGQTRILQQGPHDAEVRVTPQLCLELGGGPPCQADALPHREAWESFEDPRLGEAADLGRHPSVESNLQVVTPEQGGDRAGRQNQRGSRMAGDLAADLVGREQPRHLADQRDDLGSGMGVPQHPQSEIRLELGQVSLDPRQQLLAPNGAGWRLWSGPVGCESRRIVHLGYRIHPMTVDPALRRKLIKGDPQPLEEAWLAALEDEALDLEFFHDAARALIGAGRADSTKSLLELLDEALIARNDVEGRQRLLRHWGERLLPASKLHGEIIKILRSRFGAHSLFADLEEWVGLQRAKDDIPKTWEKVERLEHVIAYDIGSVVLLHGKGAGRVVEVNLTLKAFKVEVVGTKVPITVGFAGAKKLLTLLPEGHFLRRKVEEPEALEALRDRDPSALLALVLSTSDGPMTAQEVRELVGGIVSPAQWTSWWNAARKHPQVVALPGGRQQYTWASSSADATETLRKRFEKAHTKERLDLLRTQEPGALREQMAETLGAEAARLAGRDPARAYEIAAAIQRSGVDPGDVEWAPARLLGDNDPLELIAKIEDRSGREHATQLLTTLPNGPELAAQRILVEDEPKLIDLLLAALTPESLAAVEQQVSSQPHRSPGAFVRLAERAAEDEQARARNPLKLLQQLLAGLTNDKFAPFKKRIEALFETGSTAPRLLPLLDEDQARAAEEAIQRAHGLADYQRDPLLNALHLRYPGLRRQTESPLYATEASIEAKKAELKDLLEREIPANRKAIQEARELGDLRENFEYKSARQRHEYLSARVSGLERDLRRARPIRFDDAGLETVRIGTTVDIGGEQAQTLTILGPWESDPERGVLSNESELAGKLLGHRVGDTITGVGEILAIRAAAIDPA